MLGIDLSEAMLRLARKRAPLARFERGSLFRTRFWTEFRTGLPSCAAVCAIGEGVNYRFDRKGANRLAAFFCRVHRALKPGGVFVFDVAGPGRGSKPWLLHSENTDWGILVSKEEDTRRRILTRRMTIFRKVGRLYRRSEEVHRQRLYSAGQITKALTGAGFRVTRLQGYGKEWFAPGLTGFIACKVK